MPNIYITIGEFDKTARSYPVTVELPGGAKTRWLTKEQARGLWRSQDQPAGNPELSILLFQALLQGLETEWSNAQPLLLNELSPLPSGDPSAIRIFLEVADLELNELPWELAAISFGPNCQIIRYSKLPVSIKGPLHLPIEAIVVETRDPAAIPFPDVRFDLDQVLGAIFGVHAEIPSVFRHTRLAGASGEDLLAIVAGRQFDIVQISARAEWKSVSTATGSEGVLRLAGSAPPLNAASLFDVLANAQTRFLILYLPSDAGTDSQPPVLDLAARLRAIGGPTILVVQTQSPNFPGAANDFLYSIYDAIVHDFPLDAAVLRARRQSPQVRTSLFLAPGGEDLLRVSPLASRLLESVQNKQDAIRSLQSRAQAMVLSPIERNAVQASIDQSLSLLTDAQQRVVGISTWAHESGGILPLRQAIARAEEADVAYQSAVENIKRSESSAERVVNTHFETHGAPVQPSHSLAADREYTFCLDIGQPSATSNVLFAKSIPESYLQPFYDQTGLDLRVCLFSQQFRLANDSQLLRLPRAGPTKLLEFTVWSPPKPGPARLRACIYHRQNLLQSILVTAQITPVLQTNLESGNVAEVEFSLSDQLQVPDDLPDRTLNILVNESPEGTHTFAVLGENVKKQFSIDQGNEVKLVRQKLLAICSTLDKHGNLEYLYRDDDNSGDENKLVSDLKELAYWGWKLYSRFTMEPPDEEFESKLESTLKCPSSIQIASTRSARYVYPWSVVYDKPLISSPRNTVCPEALGLLRNGGAPGFLESVSCPQRGCAYTDDSNVVCPFRFWGFKHSIEQPANAGEIRKHISISGEPKCVIGAHSALSGTQHRREIERECKLTADYREAKTDIGTSLASTTPHVVYFYCHGGRTLSAPWLGVGNDEHIESSDLKAWNVKWPQTRPLVFINGCHTVDLSPDDLLDFVTAFNWTRASGVIGTEIAIPESLAREFGREFLRQFLAGQNVRDVMHRLRLRLLEKYNLLGLAYTPYCYGELHVVRTP